MTYIIALALLSTSFAKGNQLVDDETDGNKETTWSAGPRFKNAGDCCSLKWEPLWEGYGVKRYISSTAIPAITADKTVSGLTAYWARLANSNSETHVGVIDDSLSTEAYFLIVRSSGTMETINDNRWTTINVLSNPNGCVLKWMPNLGDRWKFSTSEIEYPSLEEDSIVYVRKFPNFVGGVISKSGTNLPFGQALGFNLSNKADSQGLFTPTPSTRNDFDVLAIDCAESLHRKLRAELIGIDFDGGDPFATSPKSTRETADDNTKILTVTEMSNNSEFDQEAIIELDSSVSSSLYMSHKSQLHDLVSTSWGVNASASLSIVDIVFRSEGEGGFDRNSMRNSLLESGEISYEAHGKRFKYSGRVILRKNTKTKVAMLTKHIKGSYPYSAKYRIGNSDVLESGQTLEHVRNSLRRQGFKYSEELKEEKGGVFYTTRGVMKIEAGVDTHITITSSPLAGFHGILERRRIVDLDPLPYHSGDAGSDYSSFSYR